MKENDDESSRGRESIRFSSVLFDILSLQTLIHEKVTRDESHFLFISQCSLSSFLSVPCSYFREREREEENR